MQQQCLPYLGALAAARAQPYAYLAIPAGGVLSAFICIKYKPVIRVLVLNFSALSTSVLSGGILNPPTRKGEKRAVR